MFAGKFRIQILLLILLLAISQSAFAFKIADESYNFSPSVGFGSNSLSMRVNDQTTLTPTNTGFYFISIGSGIFSFQTKYPQRDPEDSLRARVDSKIQDYQLSFDVYRNWKAAFYYQDYKGYYAENPNLTGIFKQPNLHFNHKGAQAFYMTNDKHSSFLIQDAFWDDKEDSQSWVITAGLDRFVLNGDILPIELKENKSQILSRVSVNSFTMRAGASKNWVWSHWFAGGAFGYGYTFSEVKPEYEKFELDSSGLRKKESKSYFNYLLAISAGYRWTTSKVGIFARASTWNMSFDDIDLTSNTSSNGLYYSMVF